MSTRIVDLEVLYDAPKNATELVVKLTLETKRFLFLRRRTTAEVLVHRFSYTRGIESVIDLGTGETLGHRMGHAIQARLFMKGYK